MHAIQVLEERPRASGEVLPLEQKAQLFDSMIAYSGRYEVLGDRLVHEIDMASDERMAGQSEIRHFECRDGRLIIKTVPPHTGDETVAPIFVVEWTRAG